MGVPYLTSIPTYNQPGPIGRPTGSQPFPTTMTDMPPGGTAGRFDSSSSQQQPQQASSQVISDPTTLTDAYGQFQRALRGTLDNARTGRLEEASRSLLEISEWLVTNARELGMYIHTFTLLHRTRFTFSLSFLLHYLELGFIV